jgi:hypothetical protein
MLNSTQKEIAEIQANVTIGPLTAPGVYRYFCTYHQDIGMIGFLIVQPNEGYVPSGSTTTGIVANTLLSGDEPWAMEGLSFKQ